MSFKHFRLKAKLKQVQAGLPLLGENQLIELEQMLDELLETIDDNDDNENDRQVKPYLLH